jgi:uncharacterized protein YjbJ (UPF0337 family)
MFVSAQTALPLASIVLTKRKETFPRALIMAIKPSLRNYQEHNMNKDQIKGTLDTVKGKLKEAAGVVLDDDALEIEGNIQKNIGKVQTGLGDIKEEIKKDN